MRQRGFVLAVVMVVVTLLGVTGMIVASRLAMQQAEMRRDLRRVQALWLARTAAASGRSLQKQLTLDGEAVSVTARAGWAEARFARWGTAHVESTAEGFEPSH